MGVVLLSIVFNVNMFAATRIHIPITNLQDNDDFFVDMNGWGVVTANSTGVISLTGNYIYNSNYQIKYTLTIKEYLIFTNS